MPEYIIWTPIKAFSGRLLILSLGTKKERVVPAANPNNVKNINNRRYYFIVFCINGVFIKAVRMRRFSIPNKDSRDIIISMSSKKINHKE